MHTTQPCFGHTWVSRTRGSQRRYAGQIRVYMHVMYIYIYIYIYALNTAMLWARLNESDMRFTATILSLPVLKAGNTSSRSYHGTAFRLHIQICIHTYIHTYIHTHTHICTWLTCTQKDVVGSPERANLFHSFLTCVENVIWRDTL